MLASSNFLFLHYLRLRRWWLCLVYYLFTFRDMSLGYALIESPLTIFAHYHVWAFQLAWNLICKLPDLILYKFTCLGIWVFLKLLNLFAKFDSLWKLFALFSPIRFLWNILLLEILKVLGWRSVGLQLLHLLWWPHSFRRRFVWGFLCWLWWNLYIRNLKIIQILIYSISSLWCSKYLFSRNISFCILLLYNLWVEIIQSCLWVGIQVRIVLTLFLVLAIILQVL